MSRSTPTDGQTTGAFARSIRLRPPRTRADLRKFGLTMTVAFGLVGGYLFWREVAWWKAAASISVAFLLLAIVAPAWLRAIEMAWMKLAQLLGAVMSRVVLTLGFVIAVVPTGLLMRLFGKDLLHLRFDRDAASYWDRVEPDGPATRPDKPY